MATRQPLLPDWWGTKHSILSAVVGTLVIVGIITAVHFSGNAGGSDVSDQGVDPDLSSDQGNLPDKSSDTWSDDDVVTFLAEEFEAGRFADSVENLEPKAKAQIPCAVDRKYISTNIITMEKVDLQFAKIQTLTPAESSPGRWNPLVKCDVIKNHENILSQVDEEGNPHGVGIDNTTSKGDRYSGQWDHGSRTGIGEYVWPKRAAYLGQWTADEFHGEGKFTINATGKSYSGEWVNDKMKGVFTVTMNGTSQQEECNNSFPYDCVDSS
eukprot:930664_1